jgi:hypothetical protein
MNYKINELKINLIFGYIFLVLIGIHIIITMFDLHDGTIVLLSTYYHNADAFRIALIPPIIALIIVQVWVFQNALKFKNITKMINDGHSLDEVIKKNYKSTLIKEHIKAAMFAIENELAYNIIYYYINKKFLKNLSITKKEELQKKLGELKINHFETLLLRRYTKKELGIWSDKDFANFFIREFKKIYLAN